MLIEDLEKVINEDTLPTEVADSYLRIYVSDIDWKTHIGKLWTNTKSKSQDLDQAKLHMKKTIACTTLMPYYDKTAIPDPPQNLLFWVPSWNQFAEKDWLDLYKKMIKSDIDIRRSRKEMLAYGVIDAIDYVPLTRQAFNWLYTKAEETNCITDQNKKEVIKKFENLVKIYGGATICNVFTKHESNISKVSNWRTGYFIEKEIYKIYTLDQIKKIKQTEISKIDPKYIKTLQKAK
jgi:hypothetical protein